MLSEKTLGFLKRMFYNPRMDWHKVNFSYLCDCQKILDVGCGKGLFLELAPERIIGVDCNFNSLKECADKGYTVIRGDALKLPFVDQSFGGVHCADLIEHFSPTDARRLLSEISRVLKVGGFLVIATPLPSKMFWNDASHVRPYPPMAIISYCVPDVRKGKETQPTYESLPYGMKFLKIMYRYTQFYQMPLHLYFDEERMKLSKLIRLTSLLFILSNLAYRIGLRHPSPEGYIIVMQKV